MSIVWTKDGCAISSCDADEKTARDEEDIRVGTVGSAGRNGGTDTDEALLL